MKKWIRVELCLKVSYVVRKYPLNQKDITFSIFCRLALKVHTVLSPRLVIEIIIFKAIRIWRIKFFRRIKVVLSIPIAIPAVAGKIFVFLAIFVQVILHGTADSLTSSNWLALTNFPVFSIDMIRAFDDGIVDLTISWSSFNHVCSTGFGCDNSSFMRNIFC